MKTLSESLYSYLHRHADLAYLLQEWDYVRNHGDLESYTCSSNSKAWWICPIGHSYDAIIRNRVKVKSGCPVCDNKRVLQGYNDLLSQCPKVACEWDYTKNVMRPEDAIVTSHKSAWWKCSNNHSWETPIRKRTRLHQPSGCPFCSNKSILVGFNDLSTTHPEIAFEWDYDKNTRSIFSIGAGSGIKVWWKCRNHSNHSWKTSPVKRSGRGDGCPYCGNQKILIGFNDLPTTHPHMLCEWDEDNTILPTEVMAGSEVKVKWKCSQNHKWEAVVSSRAVYGTGCSQCKLLATSEIEILLRDYFKQHLDNVQASHRTPTKIGKKNLYLDICGTFSEKNVAIEYDGGYWHNNVKSLQRDERKTKTLLEAGWIVVRVRENGLSFLPTEHNNLFQTDYSYSRKQADIEELGISIIEWIQKL